MNARWLIPFAVALCVGTAGAAEPQSVDIESLDSAGGKAVQLPGFWFRAGSVAAAPAPAPAPAMLLLHGCGGPYDRQGRLSQRMREYAALLNAEGIHVLVTDSLTPRGEREICTQKNGSRNVTQQNRRRDALGALQWLAAQPGVDAQRLGLLGWSNGGSNVLAAINATDAEVRAATVRPAFAVAFYPGCAADRRRGFKPVAPLLMLLGADDDWTPAAPCESLAAESAPPHPQFVSYAGAVHGFDGTGPVLLRRDVPNGVNPGQGVHVGGDAAARAASRERMLQFIRQAIAR